MITCIFIDKYFGGGWSAEALIRVLFVGCFDVSCLVAEVDEIFVRLITV